MAAWWYLDGCLMVDLHPMGSLWHDGNWSGINLRSGGVVVVGGGGEKCSRYPSSCPHLFFAPNMQICTSFDEVFFWCCGLIDAHTGKQHCWRCSSKELEEFTTKFSALKLCEIIQAFCKSLEDEGPSPKKKFAFVSFPPWAFCLFCVC